MTKLTDVQKIDIENRRKLILKLRDELDASLSELSFSMEKVESVSVHLEAELADFYRWLDDEELITNIEGQYSDTFVEGKMKSWRDLPWISTRRIWELQRSVKAQVMQRLDQISNELNERECDVPDCG